jgi:hypothetical protein
MSADRDRMIAGLIAGIPMQLIHPLDLIRTRMQIADASGNSNVPVVRGYRQMIGYIIQNEGFKGLYKGVVFSTVPNFILGAYFFINPIVKGRLDKFQVFASNETLKIMTSNIGLAAIVTWPVTFLSVLKTRKLTDISSDPKSRSIRKIATDIRKTMGIRGFFRGSSITFLMGLNSSLTFAFIDLLITKTKVKEDNTLGNFLIGGSCRFFTSIFFYPLTTVRARVEQNQVFENLSGLKYKNTIDCFSKTYRNEGLSAFYKGFLINTVRSFFATGSIILIYRNVYGHLRNRRTQHNEVFVNLDN